MNHIRCPSALQGKCQFAERSLCTFYASNFINMRPEMQVSEWRKEMRTTPAILSSLGGKKHSMEATHKSGRHWGHVRRHEWMGFVTVLQRLGFLYLCKYNPDWRNQQQLSRNSHAVGKSWKSIDLTDVLTITALFFNYGFCVLRFEQSEIFLNKTTLRW